MIEEAESSRSDGMLFVFLNVFLTFLFIFLALALGDDNSQDETSNAGEIDHAEQQASGQEDNELNEKCMNYKYEIVRGNVT